MLKRLFKTRKEIGFSLRVFTFGHFKISVKAKLNSIFFMSLSLKKGNS